jgi:hypothetical protein
VLRRRAAAVPAPHPLPPEPGPHPLPPETERG